MPCCYRCGAMLDARAAFCEQCGEGVADESPLLSRTTSGTFAPVLWGGVLALSVGVALSFLLVLAISTDLRSSGGLFGAVISEVVSSYHGRTSMALYYVAHWIPLTAGGDREIPRYPLVCLPAASRTACCRRVVRREQTQAAWPPPDGLPGGLDCHPIRRRTGTDAWVRQRQPPVCGCRCA